MSTTKQQQRVVLITGANRGLGFEVVKKLVNKSSAFSKDLILLGSRDLQRGQEAIIKLGSPSNVHPIQIDTSSSDSITQAVNEIKQKYGGQLDILINNAGIAPRENTAESARGVFVTNYYGVRLLNDQLSPFIRENGRIVNVVSDVGAWTLHEMSSDLQAEYKSLSLTKERLDDLVEEFISAVGSNSAERLGYNSKSPLYVYGVSKAAIIALTHIEARQWSGAKNVLVLSVFPGYCATEINPPDSGGRSAEIGADSILYPATAPTSQLNNGEFYQDGEQKPQSFACTMDQSTLHKAVGVHQ